MQGLMQPHRLNALEAGPANKSLVSRICKYIVCAYFYILTSKFLLYNPFVNMIKIQVMKLLLKRFKRDENFVSFSNYNSTIVKS